MAEKFSIASIFADAAQAQQGAEAAAGAQQVLMIDVSKLDASAANFYEVRDLDGLKNSIAMSGLMDPVTVTPIAEQDGTYRIISGHRRTAAIRELVAEGRDDLRQVPCFVKPSMSEALEELQLIMANSTTRVLTDGELMRQAERIESLLYELKTGGMDFPGRMDSYVAEAVGAKEKKIGRLRRIREGLCKDLLDQFETGKLSQQAAEALVKVPIGIQMLVAETFPPKKPIPGENAERFARDYKPDAQYGLDLKCADGCDCKNISGFIRQSANAAYSAPCRGSKCCMDCEANTRSWCQCDYACAAAKKQRKEAKAAKEAKEAAARDKEQAKRNRKAQKDAQRILPLYEAAGWKADQGLDLPGGYRSMTDLRKAAAGDFNGLRIYSDDFFSTKSASARLAKKLNCSVEFLLGETDDPAPPSKLAAPGWRTDTDYPDGPLVLALLDNRGRISYELAYSGAGTLYETESMRTTFELYGGDQIVGYLQFRAFEPTPAKEG